MVGKGRNSIYKQIMNNKLDFSPEERIIMARGHRFLAQFQEEMKYAEDLSDALSKSLEHLAEYFRLDRIIILETDFTNATNTLSYQWNSKEENTLSDYFQTMSEEEADGIVALYNEYGYIEVNPTHIAVKYDDSVGRIMKENVLDILLGTQLWIPTMKNGKYSGAVFFDKYDTTPYTITDKFLLSEAVNAMAVYIDRLNAENASRAKSDYLSAVSHEIRTPMNAIVGLTEVALREEMSPAMRKSLKTVQSSALGLLTLINDILDYSKIEAKRLEIISEKFNTLSLINDMYEITKARNNGKLKINLHMPENLPSSFYGDMVRIKQVMINLCSNAVKYTDKGSVDIYIDIQKIDDDNCKFLFSVKDTGIGIKKEDLKKLFKQYGQVDTTINHHKEGTGLGLMISKQLIEKMDGKISIDSVYGVGSTFSFHIPLRVINWEPAEKLEDYQYEEPEEKKVDFTAPKARILAVDDSDINLMVVSALFNPIGMTIDTVKSGYEALSMLEKNSYDLILMDHFMPGLDGVETTERIRRLDNNPNRDIPIIALTADSAEIVKQELLSNGMNDFMAKPIIIKEAYQILYRWLPNEKIQNI